MRTSLLAASMALALLAGCADPGSTTTTPTEVPEVFDEVEVTDTTGAIRGVVVTEAIAPIEGAVVTLTGGPEFTTGADGGFVFSKLEPGTYFLTASKPGFFSLQSSAEVVAGEDEPPVTKMVLLADIATTPYTTMQTWEGFIQCGFMVVNGFFGAQACGPLDDRFIHYFTIDGLPTYVQAEAVWESTQALGNDLSLSYYDGGTWHFKETNGVSPLVLNATGDDIADWWGNDTDSLPMRMFPGNAEASVTINQQFTVYMTMFHNFSPRQGWQFIVDGPCNTPADCS